MLLVVLIVVHQVFSLNGLAEDTVHEVYEQLVFGYEVGLAVDFNQGDLAAAGGHHCADDSLSSLLVYSLLSLHKTLLLEPSDGCHMVAVVFLQGGFALTHGSCGLLPQSFYRLDGDLEGGEEPGLEVPDHKQPVLNLL